jgi:hypothetical protein
MLSTKQMTYNSETRVFTTELSTIQHEFKQIYPDACDIGFTLISERTGREIDFVECSRETLLGELAWIDFRPARRQDLSLNIRVRAFND